MLYYMPLEAYKARYTMQWSAPKTGWLERRWRDASVSYKRIEGRDEALENRGEIKVGSVVDGVGRSIYAMAQIKELLLLAEQGQVSSSDVIYFDDFWHPGMEALRYAFDLMGIRPRMFAFLHAQSVDEFDFTYPMRHWMRHYERGNAAILDGIFVCGPCLQELVARGGIAPIEKVIVTGHPYASDEVVERMFKDSEGQWSPPWDEIRENKVVFTSRFDAEKNPHFFLDIVEHFAINNEDVRFVLCTGGKQIKSTDPSAIERLHSMLKSYPEHLELKENLEKEEYYRELCTAKVQLNTADQDFVAITLLEASTAGTYPIYPYFRSFPETFEYRPGFMYQRLNLEDAVQMIRDVVYRDDLWDKTSILDRQWIHKRFDNSWERMLKAMTGDLDFPSPYGQS